MPGRELDVIPEEDAPPSPRVERVGPVAADQDVHAGPPLQSVATGPGRNDRDPEGELEIQQIIQVFGELGPSNA